MNLTEATQAAWKEILGDGESPEPSNEVTEPGSVAEGEADSTPAEGTDGTSELTLDAEPDDVEDVEADETDGEDADEDEPEGDPVVIADDDVITYQGKTAKAKDLFELKSDYTRKTQELASQREDVVKQAEEVTRVYNEMVQWYESKQADPVGWLAEIAADTGNATRAVALLLTKLNEAGELDAEFAEVFDLKAPDNPVNRTSKDSEVETRIAKLEADRKAAEEEAARAAADQAAAVELNRQVSSLIDREGLSFASDRDLTLFRIELFETATAAGVTDLDVAYELLSARKARADATSSRKEQALARKRASKVSRPEASAPASDADTKFSSVDDAARAALNALMVGR